MLRLSLSAAADGIIPWEQEGAGSGDRGSLSGLRLGQARHVGKLFP